MLWTLRNTKLKFAHGLDLALASSTSSAILIVPGGPRNWSNSYNSAEAAKKAAGIIIRRFVIRAADKARRATVRP